MLHECVVRPKHVCPVSNTVVASRLDMSTVGLHLANGFVPDSDWLETELYVTWRSVNNISTSVQRDTADGYNLGSWL